MNVMQDQSEEDNLIESIKKETDVMQKVRLLTHLTKTLDVKIIDIARKIKVKSSYICHLLRLKRLPEAILDGYYSNSISLSHLFIISRIKDKTKMIDVYEKVLADSLTVKATEELVRDILYGIKTEGEYIGPEEKKEYSERVMGLRKNLKLKIIQTRIKSKIILEVKGNLENTSKVVRGLLNKIEIGEKVRLE